MRIWDIHPGYLNRASLLGEHRELHAIVSVNTHSKKGYSRHPETLRWKGRGWALRKRHALLVAEMRLRGYREQTPVLTRAMPGHWPESFIDPPHEQLARLAEKYQQREAGRIPLSFQIQTLWAHHKYSVMARDYALYREIGPIVSQNRIGIAKLMMLLVETLRKEPPLASAENAIMHMWGHVSFCESMPRGFTEWAPDRKLNEVQRRALLCAEPYLLASTALSELSAWM